jgi:hypothetical protein
MHDAEDAYRAHLADVSIADLLQELSVTISPVAIRKAAGWFQEVIK